MKKIMILALALTVLFSAPSCKRRPLSDADYNVNVVFNIDQNILNGPEMTEPEMMRVAFFDHNNGNLVAQAYLPPQGGQVSVLPGRSYDVLAYNFGTQVTFIQNENNFGRISATTNQIADSFKSKLKSRGTRSPGDETEGTIVYDPDHLFVGRLMNVDMPARSVESPEVTLTIDCQTVVQSWILCVNKIKGAQYVGSISAVITGLSQYHRLGQGNRSEEVASVFFDVRNLDRDGFLDARFNTFGRSPKQGERQILSLVITDVAGKGYIFNVDISDQFIDNPRQYILVNTDDIEIPEPEHKEGGGLAPSVDEWKDINTNINI